MNLHNLFEDDSRTPNPNYAEELAYQIFKAAPNLDTTGAADEVLDYAYDLVVNDFGKSKANALFAYDEDFDSDLVNAYVDLQMNSRAEEKKQVNEVDPRNFDSDEDYYAAQNAPAKRRSAPSDYPYSREEDDAYFNDIFRKKREAAKKAEQDKDQGVAESRMSELDAEYEDYKKLSPREFFNMYRVTKQAWLAKYKSMLPVAEADAQVNGQDVDVDVVVGKLKKFVANAEQQLQNADYDQQRQYATTVRDRAVKALNMIAQGGNTPEAASAAFKYMQTGKQGVAEADKKKEDEPEVRDVALQRAISRAKADFPTAGTGIEALAKDFMRSQDQDSKSFDQLRQAERKQDQMLGQISKIDQEQEQEIQDLETQNTTLASRLQKLQNVNGELEKKLAAMSGRRADKKSTTTNAPAIAPAPVSTPTRAAEPTVATKKKTTKAEPTTSKAIGQIANTLAPTPPSAAIDQIAQQLQPRQKELGFDEPTVLEPNIKSGRRINTSKAVDAPYRDVSVKMAKKLATDPAMRNQMYNADALRNLVGQEEMPLENKDKTSKSERPEADYGDEYQSMVKRVGQKAKEGPRKTVWDPVKQVYKTIPMNTVKEQEPTRGGYNAIKSVSDWAEKLRVARELQKDISLMTDPEAKAAVQQRIGDLMKIGIQQGYVK
jgi:hypothetical protein